MEEICLIVTVGGALHSVSVRTETSMSQEGKAIRGKPRPEKIKRKGKVDKETMFKAVSKIVRRFGGAKVSSRPGGETHFLVHSRAVLSYR